MSAMWTTVWATGQDIPRVGALQRIGAVLAMSPGGSEDHPIVAAVTAPSHTDDDGDRLHAWDVVRGHVAAVPVHAARCVASGWSRTAQVAVTGHADGLVNVWALPDLALLRTWEAGSDGVEDVTLSGSAANPVVVTLDAAGVARRWSLDDGEPLGTLGPPAWHAVTAKRLTDGRNVVVTAGPGLSMWDTETGERLPLPDPGPESLGDLVAVVLSHRDGRDVMTVVTRNRELLSYDIGSGIQVGERIDAHVDDFTEFRGRVWGGRHGRPRPVMVDGVLAVPTRWRVHLWNPSGPAPAGPPLRASVRRPVLDVMRWRGEEWLLTGSAEDGMLGLWRPGTSAAESSDHRHEISRLDLTGTGVVVAADTDGTITARQVSDGSLMTPPTRTGVRSIVSLAAWSDGTTVRAVTGAGSGTSSHPWLQRWDLGTAEEIPPPVRLNAPQIRHVAMTVIRGENVVVVIDQGKIQLRRPVDGALIEEARKHRGTYRLVVGSTDRGPIAVTSALQHPPQVFRLERLREPPVSIPDLDGGFVAAMSGDRLIVGSLAERRTGWRTLWSSDLSGRRLGPDIGGPPITSVAVAAWPGTYIARADGTVALIDLESGDRLCPDLQLPTEARTIAAAQDGDLLVGTGTSVARFRPKAGR
jgi:WD40 repeat protein